MIANSKKWAEARGLCQRSEVHGADEWRIPIKRDFEFTTRKREEIQHKGSYTLEAGNHHSFCGWYVIHSKRIQKVLPESLYPPATWKDPDGDLMNFELSAQSTELMLIFLLANLGSWM